MNPTSEMAFEGLIFSRLPTHKTIYLQYYCNQHLTAGNEAMNDLL